MKASYFKIKKIVQKFEFNYKEEKKAENITRYIFRYDDHCTGKNAAFINK